MAFGEAPVRFPAWDAPKSGNNENAPAGRGAGGTGFKTPWGVPKGTDQTG
jgi:hypothetical protein